MNSYTVNYTTAYFVCKDVKLVIRLESRDKVVLVGSAPGFSIA